MRRARSNDAPALAAIYDPIVAETCVSFEDVPPGAGEMQRRIAAGGDAFPWLVCERNGAVAGYAYAAPHRARAAYRWSVDVSVYVAPAARRAGAGRALYLELFRVLAQQGYCAAFAGVTLPNAPSCALHENTGFSTVGVYHAVGYKLGAWRDVMWFERRLRPLDEAPPQAIDAIPQRLT